MVKVRKLCIYSVHPETPKILPNLKVWTPRAPENTSKSEGLDSKGARKYYGKNC